MTRIPTLSASHAPRVLAVVCLTSVLILSQGKAWAQSGDTGSSSSGSASTIPTVGDPIPPPATTDSTVKTTEGTAPEARIPPPTSLDTGQPLWSAISPLRWSHLSLLSVSFVNVYDTNYNLNQQSASSSNIQMVQGTAAFSIRKYRSALDLQWRPSMWYANSKLNKDLYGNVVDLQSSYAFSAATVMTFNDTFRYSPALSPLSGQGFSADFTNFLLAENPFLAEGTKTLINSFGVTVNHIVDGVNSFVFDGSQTFIRMSSPPITPKPRIICLPGLPFCFIEPGPPPKAALLQVRPGMGAGVTWVHKPDARNTYKVIYHLSRDWLRGTYESDTLNHHIGGAYSRMLTERTNFSLEAGPTFAQTRPVATGVVKTTTALTGSATLFHSFTNGGIAVGVSRNYDFTGLFSDSANTRVNASITRSLTRRMGVTAGASIIEQDFSNAPHAYGGTVFSSANYRITQSIGAFVGYHYLHVGGSTQPYAPRNSISAGVSWSWAPEPQY